MWALLLFVGLNIADGIFTFCGVQRIGIDYYEGNPLIVFAMHQFGVIATLLFAKSVAMTIAALIYKPSLQRIFWWPLSSVTLVYFCNVVIQVYLHDILAAS